MSNAPSQKDVFLSGEGDAYALRNEESLKNHNKRIQLDYLMELILKIPTESENFSVLEIGCGDGLRIKHLKRKVGKFVGWPK